MPSNHHFETPDSALVAYLLSEGYTEPTISLDDNGRFVFRFQEEQNTIQPIVRAYQSGKAIGNIPIFYHNYKRVLKRIHDGSW